MNFQFLPSFCTLAFAILTNGYRLELSSFDANLPLNVNDADLHPDMDKAPADRVGATDACFNVAQSWVSNIWRTIVDTRRIDIDTGKSFKAMTIAEKESWVDKQHKRFLSRFFGNKPPETPLQHVSLSKPRFQRYPPA